MPIFICLYLSLAQHHANLLVRVRADVAAVTQMCLAPAQHLHQHGDEALPAFGERVLHFGRHFLVNLAVDEAVVLKLAQLFCQGRLRDAVKPPQQNAEPLHPADGNIPQNEEFPFAAHHRLQHAHRHAPRHNVFPSEFVVRHRTASHAYSTASPPSTQPTWYRF